MSKVGKKTWRSRVILSAAIIVIGCTLIYVGANWGEALATPATWHQHVNPGQLSNAHAHLANDCAACHVPYTGVTRERCVVCHANSHELLARQPTAFHADIGSCTECHREHLGPHHPTSTMDHQALATLGLREMADGSDEAQQIVAQLRDWLARSDRSTVPQASVTHNPALTPNERILSCAACHGNDDRHYDLFSNDCASCHGTQTWKIPEFRHPSSSSHDCAQCHQAPPSHYMKHFNMISAKVAGKPHAKVNECYECHQTTSWNDIKRVGMYKHH